MFLANFNLLDWFICITLIICCALGFVRGIIKELILITLWAASFLIAQLFRTQFSLLLDTYIPQHEYTQAIALILIFFLCLFVGGIVVRFIIYPASGAFLGFIGRIFGAVFGIIKTAIIIIVVLRLGTWFSFRDTELYTQSHLIHLFDHSGLWLNLIINHFIDALLAVNPLPKKT